MTAWTACHGKNQKPEFYLLFRGTRCRIRRIKSTSSVSHSCGVLCISHKYPVAWPTMLLPGGIPPLLYPPLSPTKSTFSCTPAKWMCQSNDLQSGLVKFTAAEADTRTPPQLPPSTTLRHIIAFFQHSQPHPMCVCVCAENAKSLTAWASQSRRMHNNDYMNKIRSNKTSTAASLHSLHIHS